MIPTREKFLFVGPTGAGKTEAMFSIALHAISAGHRVFYIAFDDGYARYLSDVDGYIVHHTDPDYTSCEDGELFHVWDAPNWVESKKAYREAKTLWEKGDWMMLDRVDMVWDFIRDYYVALREQVPEDKLDELFMKRRLEKLAEDPEEAKKATSEATADVDKTDWDVLKDSLRSVVFDPAGGTDARMMRINVVASELAVPGITSFVRKGAETEAQKKDPRKLYDHNMTIQGEKNVPSWFETVVVFEKDPRGYVISTDKDRKRKLFHKEILDEAGFWEKYQGLIGEELQV